MRESIFSIPYIKLLKSNKKDLNLQLNIPAKIALLKNITIEPLIPFLQYQCYSKNINPEFFLNDHDNIIHDAIDKNSKLYKFKPDIIYLILSLENFSEKLFNSYSLEGDEIENEISKVIEFITLIIKSLRQNSQATIILKNFEENPYLSSVQTFPRHRPIPCPSCPDKCSTQAPLIDLSVDKVSCFAQYRAPDPNQALSVSKEALGHK